MNTVENDKQVLCDDKIPRDSKGLSLRTRTISSTVVPLSLLQQTVPTSVQSNSSTSVVTGPRPRGRPPRRKNISHVANGTTLQMVNKKFRESKFCDSTSVINEGKSAASSLERLQQSINQCNGVDNYNYERVKDNENIASCSIGIGSTPLGSHISDLDKNNECVIEQISKKKSSSCKRKQSIVADVVPEKRPLISSSSEGLLETEKDLIVKSLSDKKKSVEELEYGFLTGYDVIEPYRQHVLRAPTLVYNRIHYGRTYWPTSWEYSATALTGHVQKKASKDALRKIRQICGTGSIAKAGSTAVSSKTNLITKKYPTSVIQRRGSSIKLSPLTSVEINGGLKNSPTSSIVVKRQKGRPPGRKNKLIQSVLKSNSPRKSPRQHASTLAAILSKVANKNGTESPDTLIDLDVDVTSTKNSLDVDGPCILTMAVPNDEFGVRHQRRRRQLSHQYGITKRRRRRRSITPPPPKLCAQQPAPQRSTINTTADHEVVKLRTKHVDIVRRRARDERLRAAFVCQQLRHVRETAEQNRRDLVQEIIQSHDEDVRDYQFPNNAIVLPSASDQEEIWSRNIDSRNNDQPDNMCVQIMYEQTTDRRFLYSNLPDEALHMYHQQRDLALAECLTNNYSGDTMSSDLIHHLCTDTISSNKRKKKRPNMTGWPKEKRRKVIANSSSIAALEAINCDSDDKNDEVAKRRRALATEKQRLRRQRLKLEQQQSKEKSKNKIATGVVAATVRRRGRCPGPKKKNKTASYRRTVSVSSNVTTSTSSTSTSTTLKEKKLTMQKQRQQRVAVQSKMSAESIAESTSTPTTVVKRSSGRPRGSVGRRQRKKLQLQECRQKQTSLSSEQQKENVVNQQTTGKLKCVISTRNNRMKLLSTTSGTSATSNQKKIINGGKTKKSAYNITSNCLMSSSSPLVVESKTKRTTAKRRKLHQQQHQISTSTVTWDVGRPKRYHSTSNHSRGTGVAVEEDCCFVGSQPFEQHCPGGGIGLSHNTVLENHHDHHKDHMLNGSL